MESTKSQDQEVAVDTRNVYQRFHAAMLEVGYVQKEDKKVNNQYTYASHDGVVKAVRPAILKNRMIITSKILKKTLRLQEVHETIMVYDKASGGKIPLTDASGVPQVKTSVGYVCTMHMRFRFVNIDNPKEKISAEGYGMGIDPQDKATGKASSYAKKYALLNALLLETGDDPEKDVNYTVGAIVQNNVTFRTGGERKTSGTEILAAMNSCENSDELNQLKNDYKQDINRFKIGTKIDKEFYDQIIKRGQELADGFIKKELSDEIPTFAKEQ